MVIQSPWGIKELRSKAKLRQVEGHDGFYVVADLFRFIPLNQALYEVSEENCETGKVFQYYWQDVDGEVYFVHVKPLKFYSFKDKRTYLLTVHEREYEAFMGTLVRKFAKDEETPLDVLAKAGDGFRASRDPRRQTPKRKSLVIKLVLLAALLAFVFSKRLLARR